MKVDFVCRITMVQTFPQLLLVELSFCCNHFISLVTLPVEYDASNRALVVENKRMTNSEQSGWQTFEMAASPPLDHRYAVVLSVAFIWRKQKRLDC
jgi:Zn-dependent membrane protease YugP